MNYQKLKIALQTYLPPNVSEALVWLVDLIISTINNLSSLTTTVSSHTSSLSTINENISDLQGLNLGVITPVSAAKAAATINMTNPTSDLTYTAKEYGAAGNDISVTHVDPAVESSPLSVSVDGTDITISLATNAPVAASRLIGGLTYTAVTAGADGNSITVTALDGISQTLAVSVVGTDISVQLATDGDGLVTSVAADVIAAVANSVPAAALVVCSGSGTPVADSQKALQNGADSSITSTAAQVKAAVNGDTDAFALVSCEDEGVGSGIVEAKAKANLTGGADVSPDAEIGSYGFKADFTKMYYKVNALTWVETSSTVI